LIAGAEEYKSGDDQMAEIGGGHSFLNWSATFRGGGGEPKRFKTLFSGGFV